MKNNVFVAFAFVAFAFVLAVVAGCGHVTANDDDGHVFDHTNHHPDHPATVDADETVAGVGLVGAGIGTAGAVAGIEEGETSPARKRVAGEGNVIIGNEFSFGTVKVSNTFAVDKRGLVQYRPPGGTVGIRGGLRGWAEDITQSPIGGGSAQIGDGLEYGSLTNKENISLDKRALMLRDKPAMVAIAPGLATFWERSRRPGAATITAEEKKEGKRGATVFGSDLQWGSITRTEKIRGSKKGLINITPSEFEIKGL